MRFIRTIDGLEYLNIQRESFGEVMNGFFTRIGGVSKSYYSSLNVSTSTGDDILNIRENKARIFNTFSRPLSSSCEIWQVHSDTVLCTETPLIEGQELVKADALFTNSADVTLMMRFADCVPILIYDPAKNVVGIIHAGWQGTINQIAKKSIQRITETYGCKPGDIQAVIGPSICPIHYEVGLNVFTLAEELFNNDREIVMKNDSKMHFNLWKANENLLKLAGVEKIIQTGICTACNTTRWYSHRAESGRTGRFAAVISLSN